MLPRPNCSFNIPNLNDELELDCRLYFPKWPLANTNSLLSGLAVLAHPYAPFGGCYDDPIVQTTGSIFLKLGFVLCTFNFRGAKGSSGTTSWTGKGELADYVSVYTFMLHFINQSGVRDHLLLSDGRPLLVLSGYSYGSMITSHLPDFDVMQEIQNIEDGSPDLEIEHRGEELAKVLLGYLDTQTNRGRSALRTLDASHTSTLRGDIVMGGRDSQSGSRRMSRGSPRRSVDIERVRHSIDRVRNRLGFKGSANDKDKLGRHPHAIQDEQTLFPIEPRVAYLLVSPILPPVAGFTTAFSKMTYERKGYTDSRPRKPASQNLTQHSTFAVFGDRDMFTSARKLKKWADELQHVPESLFTSREVSGAGHFWQEDGAHEGLVNATRSWIESLLDQAIHK